MNASRVVGSLVLCTLLAGCNESTKTKECDEIIHELAEGIRAYKLEQGSFPASGNANLVKAMNAKMSTGAPYCLIPGSELNEKGEVIDPWGRAIVYRVVSNAPSMNPNDRLFELYSLGPNGRDEGGGGDDVRSWR